MNFAGVSDAINKSSAGRGVLKLSLLCAKKRVGNHNKGEDNHKINWFYGLFFANFNGVHQRW